MNLQEALLWLAKHGKPMLILMDGNCWHCRLTFNTGSEQIHGSVSSSFNCKTPLEACLECFKLVNDILYTKNKHNESTALDSDKVRLAPPNSQ